MSLQTTREFGNRWCGTYNNYVSADEPKIWFEQAEGAIGGILVGKEVGESGTPHLQIYLELTKNPRNKNGRSKKWMIDHTNKKVSWRVARGSKEHNEMYCKKENDWYLIGALVGDKRAETSEVNAEKAREVKKDMMLEIQKEIENGVSDQVLKKKYFKWYARHEAFFVKYRSGLLKSQRDFQTKLIIIVGPPGTGKSHRARKIARAMGGGFYVQSIQNGKFWLDGYDPDDPEMQVVVMEEFDGSTMRPQLLLRLADKYPLRVEYKGGSVEFKAKLIIITSNKLPRDWWSEEAMPKDMYDALMRRCDGENGCVIHMVDKFVEPTPPQFSMKDIIEDLENGIVDINNEPVVAEKEVSDNNNDYDENDEEYPDVQDYFDDEVEEVDEVDEDDLDYQEDDIEYDAERYGSQAEYEAATAPLGASDGYRKLSGGVIDIDSANDRTCQNSFHFGHPHFNCIPVGEPVSKKLKRTDTSTFGLQKGVDKRWGKQPVQSKIVIAGTVKKFANQRDADDDFDDK